MKPLHLTLIFIWAAASLSAQSTITRGTEPGEIYISSNWYVEGAEMHTAIWRSTDHGQTLNLQYRSTTALPNGTMGIGKVLGDATPGALYSIAGGELWVSFDYGVSWEYVEEVGYDGRYASGSIEGEVYKYENISSDPYFFRSNNYAQNFNLVNEDVFGFPEVGAGTGEINLLIGNPPSIPLWLYASYNYAETFDSIPIHDTVAGYYLSGNYPQFTRGTKSGELYLASWWPDYHYKIFYSSDTGYTWTQQYESDFIDISYWSVSFTAGREPGSFYVKRIGATEDMKHMLMYIDYSADSAQTFTTYFHELDETYGIEELGEQITVVCYPNPFNGYTTFNIPEGVRNDKNYIEIFDIHGKLIRRIKCGSNKLIWDGTNQNGSRAANGLYFYRLNSFNYISKLNKILFVN